MRKHALIFSMLIISLSSVCQRPVKGDWMGTLNIGVKVRLLLHIKKDSAGAYTATMDSPDQGAKGIPVSSLRVQGDSLHAAVNVIKGNYDGLFINDTTVTGSWSQGPAKLALTLVKTNEVIALNRPANSKASF